ncbi:MAG TPA: phosphoenolpyruvate carboxylase, partial [Chloroflexota bacterium]|nr:phosphoenolpyruvate carboxylase [Chloroflexota bacterium]
RYANPKIAHRHLEQTVHAVIRASLLGHGTWRSQASLESGTTAIGTTGAETRGSTVSGNGVPEPGWSEAMETISATAMNAYRDLVYGNPQFLTYFRQATPIDQIADLRIGSRPAKRKRSDRIEDLRAIPWVFSWTQSRHGIPGWFGMGSAFSAFVEARGEPGWQVLEQMYRQWPFFRSLVDNAQLGMGKADLAIARLYAGLVEDTGLRHHIFGAVEEEWHETERAILRITGQRAVLENSPVLMRSIQLRNPYVDPMSFVQVSLLRRLREEPTEPAQTPLEQLVALTINGIAAGLQNTG